MSFIDNIVRIGTVTAVDEVNHCARCHFHDLGITSGWLYVLQHINADVYISPDNEHTHSISDTYTGGGSATTVPKHEHQNSFLKFWMPKVSDVVLVLFIPVNDGDGFILGQLPIAN